MLTAKMTDKIFFSSFTDKLRKKRIDRNNLNI